MWPQRTAGDPHDSENPHGGTGLPQPGSHPRAPTCPRRDLPSPSLRSSSEGTRPPQAVVWMGEVPAQPSLPGPGRPHGDQQAFPTRDRRTVLMTGDHVNLSPGKESAASKNRHTLFYF